MKYLLWFVGVDASFPKESGEWSIDFARALPGWLLLILGVLLLGAVWWLYHLPRGNASPRMRFVLGSLRMGILLLIGLVLLQPVLRIEKSRLQQSKIVLLIDTSMSMSLTDSYSEKDREALALTLGKSPEELKKESRLELALSLLTDARYRILERLARTCTVKVFEFSGGVSRVEELRELKPRGYTTRLGDAIAEIVSRFRGQRLAGIVVFTDGRSNAGMGPVRAVKSLCAPSEPPVAVFTVGVGSAYEPPDSSLGEIFGSDIVALGDRVTFQTSLTATGLRGKVVRVELLKEGEVLDSKEVSIVSQREHHNITLSFKPTEAGQFTYTIRVSSVPGERNTRNNSRTHTLRVVDRKLRVLLLADKASWEYRYLKNALLRDSSVTATCLLQSGDPGSAVGPEPRRYPTNTEELFQYDCIIWQDINPQGLSGEQIRDTVRFVEDVGGGFVLQAGPINTPAVFRDTPLEELLPVYLPDVESSSSMLDVAYFKEPFKPRMTRTGFSHPILDMGEEDDWERLPPLYWFYPTKRLKPAAQALLVHPFEGNDYGNYSLLALQFYGSGRSMFIGFDSTWLWRYWQGDKYFYRFWGQAIRFVSTGRILGGNRRLSISTDKKSYQVGEQIRVRARRLDENYRPLERDSIEVRLESSSKTTTIKLQRSPGHAGVYSTVFPAGAPGTYTVRLVDGAEEASRVFEVTMPKLEFASTRLDIATLKAMSRLSTGEYLPLREAHRLPEVIRALEKEITIEIRDEIWDSPLVITLFVLLLSLEWILRKWRLLM